MLARRVQRKAAPRLVTPSANHCAMWTQRCFLTLTPLAMPSLSPTMEHGRIAEWQKKVGEEVSSGDTFCMVETDKATVPFNCNAEEGFLAKILKGSDAGLVKVGDAIGLMVDEKEGLDSDEVKNWKPDAAPADAAAAEPQQQAAPAAVSATPSAAASSTGGRVFASPLGKSIAKELGIDLATATVRGTGGAVGRVTKADVMLAAKEGPTLRAATQQQPAAAAAAATRPPPPPPPPQQQQAPTAAAAATPAAAAFTDIPTSMMRQTIAKRLTQSKNIEVPHYYLMNELKADNMLQIVKHLNAKGDGKYKISVNDFLIKAIARANLIVPECNTHWHGDFMRRYSTVDISVAVATPNGLITPIIKDAHVKGLVAISAEMKALAAKARDGTLQPHEYQGGTASISNLGGMGIPNFTAIVNPPQSMILAVGNVQPRQKIITKPDGEYELTNEVERTLCCTASFDHRVVDGAIGAQWFKHFKDTIENPLSFLL